MNTIVETLAGYNAVKKNEVLAYTWGHLAPEKGKEYHVRILFSKSPYNQYETSLIDTAYSEDLNDSPWLYDTIIDKINEVEVKRYGVYLLEGLQNQREGKIYIRTLNNVV